jgi:hypothetical protein
MGVIFYARSSFPMARSTEAPTESMWLFFTAQILPQLTVDDDPALWRAVIEAVIGDAETVRDDGRLERFGRRWWRASRAARLVLQGTRASKAARCC